MRIWQRLKDTGTGAGLVLAPVLGVFLLARLIQLGDGRVMATHDSAAYAPRVDAAFNHGPLVSFVGNAPRPWGLPLFYAMFTSDQSRAVGQWAVATAVWALLAIELASQLRTRTAKVTAASCVAALALTNTVASWDFAILTESLSISLGVLVIALFLRWRRLGGHVWLAALTVTAVWWTFIRPDIRLFTVLIVALLMFLAWREWRASPKRAGFAALSAAILLAAIGWYAAITPAMSEAFKPYNGDAPRAGPLPVEQEYFIHRLRTIVYTDPKTESVFKHDLGMPSCPEVDAFASRAKWDTVEFTDAVLACTKLRNWAAGHQYDFWGTFVSGAPGPALRKYLELSSVALSGERYAHVPSVAFPFEKLVFPTGRFGLLVAALAFLVAALAAFRTGAQRRQRLLARAAYYVFCAGILSAFATVLLGTGEYRRFGIQETVATRISILILAVCALDAVLTRRRDQAGAVMQLEQGETK